jgi:hypothetical protein
MSILQLRIPSALQRIMWRVGSVGMKNGGRRGNSIAFIRHYAP